MSETANQPTDPQAPPKPAASGAAATSEPTLYGGVRSRRVTVRDLQAAKERGERWGMLTSYDMLSAQIFDEAGIPVLLVGDSAGNNVLGYETTVPVQLEELLPLTRAVVGASKRAMVVGDLPFGSYQASPEQAFMSALRLIKEGGAHAVKLEGGRRVVPQVELLANSGMAVMGHIGLTPQSVHGIGGFRVQGRGEDAGEQVLADALALQQAGAFAVVLELVPATLAERVSRELTIPTIGIGAGAGCDAQVLVWTDMAGLNAGPGPRFVKRYADLRGTLSAAAAEYAEDVRTGRYPSAEHSYT
ncbi:MAG TPA: 3-methyl-2-oxobutanoate hydroxymethyltransferase [Frankiaceae bacterium]|nr:3-methyl-2-oxobutanoate hydroxymethyltransferase [Frankiaceae bacterium]